MLINKSYLKALTFITLLLLGCANEEDESSPDQITSEFSAEDMTILDRVLDLPETPFNYANMELPWHYKTDDVGDSDNTPDDNHITDMGATLGRVLFYDKNLSTNNTISCASCHQQSAAFSDNAKFSKGLNGQLTKRNSMTLINSRYYENGRFFWDERASTLEEQVLMPIQDHIEMGMNLNDLVNKLQKIDYYPVLFKNAFGSEEVTADRIARALSQFNRSIISVDSKFDEGLKMIGYVENEEEMPDLPNFTEQENLGIDIFFRGRKGGTCLYCHGTPQNVNDEAKNNGLALSYLDNGKGDVTGRNGDKALFKVPSLRNISMTAPYMHDGRFETLMDVVNHYSDNIQDHPNLNFRLKTLDDGEMGDAEVLRLNLTQEEKKALVAFLNTLTDTNLLTDEKYSNPFKQ